MYNAPLDPLLPLFERERAAGRAVALGVLVNTIGSTYRKPGALILIAAGGEYAGLLSGGCLEGDLGHHAQRVIDTGEPKLVFYDTRGSDDALWGIGLGCDGAMEVLLLRVGPDTQWQPLAHLRQALTTHTPTAIGIITESAEAGTPVGTIVLPDGTQDDEVHFALQEAAEQAKVGWVRRQSPLWTLFTLPLWLPPRLLLLGAGPDAIPMVDFATRLGWKVTLADHRPAYAQASHFPSAENVVLSSTDRVADVINLANFSAAIVMSHHLPSDLAHLRTLAHATVPYVGLLGPARRREKLLEDLGDQAQRLRARLHSPVGLALGGRTPESIALAVVAEVHAFVFKGAAYQPRDS